MGQKLLRCVNNKLSLSKKADGVKREILFLSVLKAFNSASVARLCYQQFADGVFLYLLAFDLTGRDSTDSYKRTGVPALRRPACEETIPTRNLSSHKATHCYTITATRDTYFWKTAFVQSGACYLFQKKYPMDHFPTLTPYIVCCI